MCTLTYIPKQSDSFIITHSRDESIKRPMASPPISKLINGVKHIFPVDMKGGGTWIGISEYGRVACLLNGGWVKHEMKPPYKHSRGLVIPDFFRFPTFEEFVENYDFDGLEPFTLLTIESNKIGELVFDGNQTHVSYPDINKSHIYCSSTLYSDREKSSKQALFNEWLVENRFAGVNESLSLHRRMRFYKEFVNPISGELSILKTVSTTSIFKEAKKADIRYHDHLNDMQLTKKLKLKAENPAYVHA
jgi:uncharacterized protein with NRDE domain